MSALQRARRSSSKTAPETGADMPQMNGALPTSTSNPSDPSLPPSLLPPPAAAPMDGLDPESETVEVAAVLSSIPSGPPRFQGPPMVASPGPTNDDLDDQADNRSSSLSELGDTYDERSEPTPRAGRTTDLIDNDSEAETERLEKTPRKLTRTGTATSLASEQLYEPTPSRLAQTTAIDEDESAPASPSPVLVAPTDTGSGNAALDTLSFLAASEAVSLELAGKKRKRSNAENGSVEELPEEPARKRSSTGKEASPNGDQEDIDEDQMDVEAELDNAEDRISVLAQEEVELEERQAEVATDTVAELATVAKLTKPRKGRGRGKRKMDTAMSAEAVLAEVQGMGDADNDEDDSSSLDEEAAKKKNAIDELAKIERKFKIFREKLCDEQIAQGERELEMLKEENCQHPEYLAMIQCINERRAGKIEYERQLRKHKLQCLERQTIAQRHQLHSQYFQTVRYEREKILAECNQRVYELQRGRRQLGVDEVEYALRLPEKRSERIRQQTAYNMEVSILSGVAKYVGFPAAPEIKPARPSEVDEDFRAMKITTRAPPPPIPYVRPAYTRNSTADEVAAEEQFIEKTPWANPQHPAHQHSHYAVMATSRAPAQTYQTPAGQRRVVDIHAPNGSASTIDALSNPPSSTAGAGMQSNGRMAESISPVLQMKRNPSDHLHYADTPASLPRNFVGIAREGFPGQHVLSSPAGDIRHEDQHGPRWAAMNGGAPPLPHNVARQVPLSQRNGLGTVAHPTAAALFGR